MWAGGTAGGGTKVEQNFKFWGKCLMNVILLTKNDEIVARGCKFKNQICFPWGKRQIFELDSLSNLSRNLLFEKIKRNKNYEIIYKTACGECRKTW